MKQQKATRKAWVELPKKTMETLDKLARFQGRSRANLFARILQIAADHPDTQRDIAEMK